MKASASKTEKARKAPATATARSQAQRAAGAAGKTSAASKGTIAAKAVPTASRKGTSTGKPATGKPVAAKAEAKTKAAAKAAPKVPAKPRARHPASIGTQPAASPAPAVAMPAGGQPESVAEAALASPLAPDAPKATFTPIHERETSLPVTTTIQKDPSRANNWKTLPVEQLTDQDVLAMPDSEYMNEVQLAFFKRKLLQLKADMLANAGETTEHLREDTVVVPDPADRATIEEEHALELRTRDRERKLLKKIEQALARIESGEYGYCEETGEPIGVARLMARPTASLSLEAQQRRELKQKLYGD